VGLHDEINSIIAIVGLCSLSEQGVIILGYMAVNESNHWHKACNTAVRYVALYPFQLSLTEPLPVDVFTTNNNKTKAFEKDGERRAR